MRGRVPLRAQRIADLLEAHPDQPFTKWEICSALNLQYGSITDSAFRLVREELAPNRDYMMRFACPANGHTYMFTKDPALLLDGVLHMRAIEDGVHRANQPQLTYLQRNKRKLEPIDRIFVEMEEQVTEQEARMRKLCAEARSIVMAARREARSSG